LVVSTFSRTMRRAHSTAVAPHADGKVERLGARRLGLDGPKSHSVLKRAAVLIAMAFS